MTPEDEKWKLYRKARIRLWVQWGLVGFCVMIPALSAIIVMGGKDGVMHAGLFAFPLLIVAYLFRLRDEHRLSQKFFRQRKQS